MAPLSVQGFNHRTVNHVVVFSGAALDAHPLQAVHLAALCWQLYLHSCGCGLSTLLALKFFQEFSQLLLEAHHVHDRMQYCCADLPMLLMLFIISWCCQWFESHSAVLLCKSADVPYAVHHFLLLPVV